MKNTPAKNAKGSVVVCVRKGMLCLQFPRHLFGGTQKYLYLQIPDTPINRQSASARARAIEADIAFDKFDDTLESYKPLAIKPDTSPGLNALWEKYTAVKAKTLSHSTIDREFKRIANHINKLPSDRLKDARKMRKYLIENLNPKSAKKVLMYLSACCEWAKEEELVLSNPFNELPKLKIKSSRTINPFSKAERDQIIAAFESSYYYKHYTGFVRFLFLTGCRTGEAVGLQWKHISPDLKTITFSESVVYGKRKSTKTDTVRKFPVNEQLYALLVAIRPVTPSPDALVFPSPTGIPIDAHNFLNKAWKTVLGTLPIEYRTQYTTRHTFASLCLEAGVKINQIAEWIGNSPETIWKHYAGLINTQDVPEL
ncbi:tyrosine-type recombinase/integrase [Argonema antarcticum]|uniref:tyrosine-type recombinase/integrase n=1 Tax=Argonema antarcticum TaxID=2942763 RepID=UPI002010C7D2|nr:tyrosine-type recombinase/integrase [Argonema antarcticum]MCL1474410.1 tyrosine-type recombinase/integrase [Argonema antarcticum A004/B2]